MRSPVKRVLTAVAGLAAAILTAGCGTEKVNVPKSQGALHQGAVLFNQRCAGCHTLSYAGTHGSAANVRTAQYNNGPNFDIRCERPVTRVLYAIQNGGFSGAIMPQNVVVGQQAIEVAKFVSTYAGRKAPKVPGSPTCESKPVGTIPTFSGSGTAAAKAQAGQASKVQRRAAGPVSNTKRHRGANSSGSAISSGQGKGPGY